MIRPGRVAAVAVLLFSVPVRSQEPFPPLTLEEGYALALRRSENAAISEEDLRQAEGLFDEIRARALPVVGFRATNRLQDTSGVSDPDLDDGATRRWRPEAGFYIRQTIFAGFREFSALKAQRSALQARSEDIRRARHLLYEDVGGVFYAALQLAEQVKSLEALEKATEERLKELKRRVSIGRSRESEALSTESQLASLGARLERARGDRAAALELLVSLVGRPVTDIAVPPETFPVLPSLNHCLQALSRRPDLLSAAGEAAASEESLAAVRRQAWPILALEGNYYTKRTGTNEPIDWDALFSLDAPLFRGGQLKGALERTRSEAREAALRLAQRRRLGEEEVRVRRRNALTTLAEAERLFNAAGLAERNYRAQQKEYGLGLVNNLEVLAALNSWEETKLEYDRRRLEAHLDALRLRVSIGDMPEVK